MPSPFANKVFRKLSVTFKVTGTSSDSDERGNAIPSESTVTEIFKISTPSANAERQYATAEVDETLTGYVVNKTGTLDRRIQIGSIGEGEYLGKFCTVEVRSLGQSSVLPATKVLGEKYTLLLRFRSRADAGV